MDPHRTRLDALIFHNETVLPRTSPGFGEVSLAVAELQGGNYQKASILAEIAVGKDPQLAAGWLAKMAADVYEATPDDLRRERAVFCADRALECAPSCRREMVEFFVAYILGHYVEVLCAGAAEELAQWLDLEAQADETDERAEQLRWQADQMRDAASLLEMAGLVSGFVALFSHRLGTKVFSGAVSLATLSEASRKTQYAGVLDTMGANLRAAGNALRQQGVEHRTASMFYFVHARDLIDMASQLLRAENLPLQSLDDLVQTFDGGFRHVLGSHLHYLDRKLRAPMRATMEGQAQSLAASYAQPMIPGVRGGWSDDLQAAHPLSQSLVAWLGHMLPEVQHLGAYRLLAYPMPVVAKRLYGFDKPLWVIGLPERLDNAYKMGCLLIVGMVCAVFLLWSLVLTVPAVIGYGILMVSRRLARSRLRRDVAHALWSVDTWLPQPFGSGGNWSPALSRNVGQTPLPLPGTNRGRVPRTKTKLSLLNLVLISGGIAILLFVALVVLFVVSRPHPSRPRTTGSETPEPATPTSNTNKAKPAAPEVRRALPAHGATIPLPSQTGSSSSMGIMGQTYSVVGIAKGDTLNVRTGPGTTNGVSSRLPNGYRNIQVIGAPVMNDKTRWVQIKFGESTGWVTDSYLKPE